MIVQIKLNTGEEIIGDVTKFSDSSIVYQALLIERIPVPVENEFEEFVGNNVYYTMRNWFYNQFETTHNQIKLNQNSVVSEMVPTDNTISQYKDTLKHFQDKILTDDSDAIEMFPETNRGTLH